MSLLSLVNNKQTTGIPQSLLIEKHSKDKIEYQYSLMATDSCYHVVEEKYWRTLDSSSTYILASIRRGQVNESQTLDWAKAVVLGAIHKA